MKFSLPLSTLAIVSCVIWSTPSSAAILGSTNTVTSMPVATSNYIVSAGCAVPENLTGTAYYVDPVHGNIANNGSASAPWDTLQNVMIRKKSLIKGGDTINLMSGNHGTVGINNMVNSSFVTIQAAPGQKPVLTRLAMYGVQKLIVRGLKIQSLKTTLAAIGTSSTDVISQNIIFTDNTLSTQDSMDGWTQAQWVANASSGLSVNGAPDVIDAASPLVDGVPQSHHSTNCITVSNNTISNVKLAVGMQADHSMYTYNKIDNYAWDAVDYGGNWLTLSNNTTTNILDIADGMHLDCYQGFLPGGKGYNAATFSNVTIASNMCIRQTNPNLAFVGSFQGIDNFDGGGYRDWYNLKVTNNLIVTNQWNCINFGGIHNSSITNNSCLADGIKNSEIVAGSGPEAHELPGNIAWIALNDFNHFSQKSNNVTVANNVATGIQAVGATDPSNSITNNVASQQVSLFVKGVKKWYNVPGNYGGNILDPSMMSFFKGATSVSTKLGPMLVYNPAWKAGSPYMGKGAIIGNSSAAPNYTGTMVLVANARQIGLPKLDILINGVQVAEQIISSDVHTGPVGIYKISYSSATPPKTIDIKLNGYTSTEQKYVSVNLYNLIFTSSSGKSVDLVRHSIGKIASGQARLTNSGVMFFTNGSTAEFNAAE